MSTYLQIFSMTDHAQPVNNRYQGPYSGINADLTTSELHGSILCVDPRTKTPNGSVSEEDFKHGEVVLAYRHTDSGVLEGTSESLMVIPSLPWTDMPGIEIASVDPDSHAIELKLWEQDLVLDAAKPIRIRFGKTLAFLRNLGAFESVSLATPDAPFQDGPMHLHALDGVQEITLAPPSGSGLVAKMGQEIKS